MSAIFFLMGRSSCAVSTGSDAWKVIGVWHQEALEWDVDVIVDADDGRRCWELEFLAASYGELGYCVDMCDG
jgi:hypothetical protein